MRALSKLLSFWDEFVAAFFVELLRLMVLTIFILCKQWKHVSSSCKYRWTINKKSYNFAYNKMRTDDSCSYCSICQCELTQGDEAKQLVDCRHVFHRRCLERWLELYRATCPLCRSAVVPPVIVAEYHKTQMDQQIQKELALILLKKSTPNTVITYWACNVNDYSQNDPYADNVEYVLADLVNLTPNAGYDYYTHSPSNSDVAYGHATCSAALSYYDCADCLGIARDSVKGICGSKIGATIDMVDCTIRYENYSFS